jgi:thymidylate kinase
MSLKMPFALKPGCVVVLEGLDATGKSTQHEMMERACMGMGHGSTPLFDPAPLFLHMPSAGTAVGEAIYKMTEDMGKELDPLARQFLHLASHAQSVEQMIKPAIKEGQPVILDRWWWSTIAYGWYGGRLGNRDMSRREFEGAINGVWRDVKADMVAVFMHPHKEDKHNTRHVVRGYEYLIDTYPSEVELIGPGDEGEQGEQLYAAMVRRGLYRSG